MSFKRKLALFTAFAFALVSLFALAYAESGGETTASSDPVKIWQENDAGGPFALALMAWRDRCFPLDDGQGCRGFPEALFKSRL